MVLLYHFIPSDVNPLWGGGGAFALPQKYSSAIHAINIKKVALPPAKQEVGRNDADEYVINNYLLLSIQWSSEVWDSELGLVYYNYRHYNIYEGRWISKDFIISSNHYDFIANANNRNDILGLTEATEFTWTGTWYDDEGGPGIGVHSNDIKVATFNLHYSFKCRDLCHVDGVNLNSQQTENVFEDSSYLYMVNYRVTNSITEQSQENCKKSYRFRTNAHMSSVIRATLIISLAEVNYEIAAMLIPALQFTRSSKYRIMFYLGGIVSGQITDVLGAREEEASKVLLVTASCKDLKKPLVTYQVSEESTAGTKKSITFSANVRGSEMYIYNEKITIK